MLRSFDIIARQPNSLDEFSADSWLLSNIGSLVFGGKPAELLSVNYSVVDFSREDLKCALLQVSESLGLGAVQLHETEHSQKILLYSEALLRSHLSSDVLRFLIERFLPEESDCSLERIISGLSEEWCRTNRIPHEVGFFLGYPLEDVFGFIANGGRNARGNFGWQVYGCLFAARRVSMSFLKGRSKMLALLEGEGASKVLFDSAKEYSPSSSNENLSCPAP